jgi:hypothetical protein
MIDLDLPCFFCLLSFFPCIEFVPLDVLMCTSVYPERLQTVSLAQKQLEGTLVYELRLLLFALKELFFLSYWAFSCLSV